MRPDIFDLESFYASRLGQRVRRKVARALARLVPDLEERDGLALGYPLPFLSGADRFAVVMPREQGARAAGSCGSRVVLAHEHELPFADRTFACALLVHALEHSPRPGRLLRELWRVLADGGLLVAVVPNRHGLWSLSERTPFGTGRPFTAGALRALLREQLFEPCGVERALFWPPLPAAGVAGAAERIGRALLPELSGVVLVAAEKRIALAPVVPAAGRSAAAARIPALFAGHHAREHSARRRPPENGRRP
ncbi:hypothetical protein HRbin39_00747 [bacterium HR39]|nr:hypothetical protein HRbin39_00747 [bacterium HR39]